MAQFFESELHIIGVYPIKDKFNTLLSTINSMYPNAKLADSQAGYETLLTDPGTCNAQRFRSS